MLQAVVAIAAGAMAIVGVVALRAYLEEDHPLMLLFAILFGIIFLWLFGMALRLPTSFIAISQDRMRIRFGGFVDTVVETSDVAGAQLIRWNLWKGIGVRTAFGGDVALVGTWGTVAELTLKHPIRVWLIPRILPVRATRITVSVRNPHKLVERFGPVKIATAKKKGRGNK